MRPPTPPPPARPAPTHSARPRCRLSSRSRGRASSCPPPCGSGGQRRSARRSKESSGRARRPTWRCAGLPDASSDSSRTRIRCCFTPNMFTLITSKICRLGLVGLCSAGLRVWPGARRSSGPDRRLTEAAMIGAAGTITGNRRRPGVSARGPNRGASKVRAYQCVLTRTPARSAPHKRGCDLRGRQPCARYLHGASRDPAFSFLQQRISLRFPIQFHCPLCAGASDRFSKFRHPRLSLLRIALVAQRNHPIRSRDSQYSATINVTPR